MFVYIIIPFVNLADRSSTGVLFTSFALSNDRALCGEEGAPAFDRDTSDKTSRVPHAGEGSCWLEMCHTSLRDSLRLPMEVELLLASNRAIATDQELIQRLVLPEEVVTPRQKTELSAPILPSFSSVSTTATFVGRTLPELEPLELASEAPAVVLSPSERMRNRWRDERSDVHVSYLRKPSTTTSDAGNSPGGSTENLDLDTNSAANSSASELQESGAKRFLRHMKVTTSVTNVDATNSSDSLVSGGSEPVAGSSSTRTSFQRGMGFNSSFRKLKSVANTLGSRVSVNLKKSLGTPGSSRRQFTILGGTGSASNSHVVESNLTESCSSLDAMSYKSMERSWIGSQSSISSRKSGEELSTDHHSMLICTSVLMLCSLEVSLLAMIPCCIHL